MGFRITEAAQIINATAHEAYNPINDGFVDWGAKQDLYRLKEILDAALKRCPNFGSTEHAWLREQEKTK